MKVMSKRFLAIALVVSMLTTLLAGIPVFANSAEELLLHLDFSDASQINADSYGAFYSNRDVFTKHGNGSDAAMDMSVEDGKLVIANKTGWARPVIRFNHGFEAGKTYRIEFVIEKADPSATLSVEHLIQITGSLDGNWPTAPDVMTSATVIDGTEAKISLEFSFTLEDGAVVFHSGDYSSALPANASLAAFDYAIVLGGTSTGVYIDDFKLIEVASEEPEQPEVVDPDALLHLNFADAAQANAEQYSQFYSNRDVFTKHGNGSDAAMDMSVENGKLVIANKTGWARPVIRFNHGFEAGKTYRIEFVIEKADPSATLSVEHLIQITGSLDGNWPTAPDVMTSATVIDGTEAKIALEFSFTLEDGAVVFHSGDYSSALPANASLAAFDYAIVLGGTSTGVYIDDFKLIEVASEEPEQPEVVDPDALLHLNFADAAQANAEQYSQFYSSRDVFTKHGNGSDATMDMSVADGKLVIANKTGWARPVIRFNHGFEAGKTYRIEFVIEKADPSATLSVEHLIQITGSLDGNWPTAPDVMTSATVIDGNSQKISLEFSFTLEDGAVVFHSGDYSSALPANASLAAFDYAIVLGGTSTGVYIDDFKLIEIAKEEPEVPASDALLHLNFADAAQANAEQYSQFYSNRDVFTKHGNGSDATMDMSVENGKLVIANKTGWARPVIRFNHGFEAGKTYRIEFVIEKADPSATLSVEHLIQITGSLDGNWPTAPDVMTSATVIDGNSQKITLEFSFTLEDGAVVFHSGDYSSALPANASLAAFDYAIVLGGTSTGVYIDDFALFETGSLEPDPGEGGDEEPEQKPEVNGIISNSFHSASEINTEVGGYMGGAWSVNGGDGTTTLTVEESLLKITDRTGSRAPAIRIGGGDKYPSNNTYSMVLRAKNLAAGDQSLGYYIQFIGYKDGQYPVLDFGTASVKLTDEYLMTVSTQFAIEEKDGVITIITANGKKSFEPGVTLAAIDVFLVTEGADSKTPLAIDNFYVDYYKGEISLDFEDENDIYNTANSHHSVAGVMTPNVGGTSNYGVVLVPGEGLDGSTAMHAIGAASGWRPEIRMSQGTAKVKPGEPYAVNFWVRGADPEQTTKIQLAYGVYYTMPGAPSVYLYTLLYGSLVVVDGQWKEVTSNFIISVTENGYLVTDGTSYKTIPAEATIAAVDCGLLMLNTTDKQTNYYIDDFKLLHLLENPISMDGIGDDSNKIVKNGGMEDPNNYGYGRAWAPSENANILLELVEYEAYAGNYSLKISERTMNWHRAQQRLDDLSIFTEGKKFLLSGAVMSEEDTYFSLSIYVTLGFRDEENPSDINYAAMEVPLTTEFLQSNIWNYMYGEFGIYRNADGNLCIINADTNDTIILEIPAESVGIAAIDVWFTTAAGCDLNPLTAYYIDNIEMVEAGTYAEGDALEGVFEDVDAGNDEPQPEDGLLYADDATGVKIYGDSSAIPAGAQFQVERSTDHPLKDILANTGIHGREFYAVKLLVDGEEVQALGELTIVIPCGEKATADDKLLLVLDSAIVDTQAQVGDDCYHVTVDILGVFTIATPGNVPDTSDNSLVLWASALMLMAGAAVIVLFKRKEQTA